MHIGSRNGTTANTIPLPFSFNTLSPFSTYLLIFSTKCSQCNNLYYIFTQPTKKNIRHYIILWCMMDVLLLARIIISRLIGRVSWRRYHWFKYSGIWATVKNLDHSFAFQKEICSTHTVCTMRCCSMCEQIIFSLWSHYSIIVIFATPAIFVIKSCYDSPIHQ